MIKAIKLTRFKQFKETKIELRPFSILMGENNSGKTSVLQALWLAQAALHRGRLLSVDERTHRMKSSTNGYYLFDVPFAPQDDLASLFYHKISRKGPSWDESSGAIIEITDEYENHIALHLRDLFKNLNFKLLKAADGTGIPQLQNYEPLYISGFVGMHFQEERVFPAAIEAKIADGNVNSILRNIILDLKLHNPEKFEYFNTLLSTEFGFHIKDIYFHEDNDRYIVAEYGEGDNEGGISLDFSSSGSGILQIVQIIAVILRYCPEKTRIVLIDEPDAHLHGNLQVKFANILLRIQKQFGLQIILSTHSAAIIQNADPEDVIPILACAPVNRSLTGRDEVQKTIADRLDAYELGKARISGKIAFFEDTNLDIFEKMADVLHIDSFSGINTIPTIRGRGKDDKLPYSLNAVLQELLEREIKIHIIRDSDGMSEEVKHQLEEFAERHHVILHILSRYEVENYVLNAELIFRTLTLEPRNAGKEIPSKEEIQEKITEALRETIRGGIYKYHVTLSEVLYKVKHNLLGERDYKTDDAAHETDRIYRSYYEEQDPEKLLKIGMGKQARGIVFAWLNQERGLIISQKGMLRNLRPEDICDEIKNLLLDLKADLSPDSFRDRSVGEEETGEMYEQLSFIENLPVQ